MHVTEGKGRVSIIKGRRSLACLHIPWSRAGKTRWAWPHFPPRPSLLDCHSSAHIPLQKQPHPSPEPFSTRTGGRYGLNPPAAPQLSLLSGAHWIPGHPFSCPCPSDLTSDWFSLLDTCLGLYLHMDLVVPCPEVGGKRLQRPKTTAELSPLWVPPVRRIMALCLMCQLSLWPHHPDEHVPCTCGSPAALSRGSPILWWPNQLPNLPQNMISLRSLWILQINSQRTSYTQDKLLIIKQSCSSVPGPYFTTDGSQLSGLPT